MPVDSKHPLYKKRFDEWVQISAVMEGEKAVKAAGETLLPKLSGQDTDEYIAYKKRGSFKNLTAKTVSALSGALMRKASMVEVPEKMESYLKDITLNGSSFDELAKQVGELCISHGHLGMLVSMDDYPKLGEPEPYVAVYGPEAIINWQTEIVDGEEVLVFLVLEEIYYERDERDEYEWKEKVQYRVLKLDEENKLVVEVWIEAEGKRSKQFVLKDDPVYPNIRGKRLNYIPFVFVGANNNDSNPEKSPVLDVVNLNLAHWRLTADYYHGLHFTALPTPWAAGFDIEGVFYVGGSKILLSADPSATAGYMEFTGKGLGAIAEERRDLVDAMAVLGSRMLEVQKKAAEAMETQRMKQGSDTATLIDIASSVEKALTRALILYAMWLSLPTEDISVRVNRDFVDVQIDSQTITALLKSYMSSAISLDTFLWNLKQGEIIPPDRTVDDEVELIDLQANKPFQQQEPEEDGE
jgi:hypothetical protein